MKKGKKPEMEGYCPIKQTIRILGKRWTILIIKELYYAKRMRMSFMELRRSMAEVSTKVLSERLKELVDEGIIKRTVKSEQTPVRVFYSLTQKGKDACDILDAFKDYGIRWGSKDTVDCSGVDCELCPRRKDSDLKP